jgi:hypothetical protein
LREYCAPGQLWFNTENLFWFSIGNIRFSKHKFCSVVELNPIKMPSEEEWFLKICDV